jgi:hypothetical protein
MEPEQPLSSDTYRYFLHDLMCELKEKALNAKALRERFRNTELEAWHVGQLYGYHTVIHLMQEYAWSFGIPLEELLLDDINPEKDLL